MNYVSTRNIDPEKAKVSSAEAIKKVLATDGGLYMPEALPALSREELLSLMAADYPTRAATILSKFLTDYTTEELLTDCRAAYGEPFGGNPAPVARLSTDKFVLELYHGPTCAFKDMALQIMPRLLSRALQKTGEKNTAMILVATSGDTGKAALEGYRDVDGVKILVFYPDGGVSPMQKQQMTTQEGKNVAVSAVRGNFDDAQNGVKRIFSDDAVREKLLSEGVILSSANSINWGRLAPQIVYYVSAYLDLVKTGDLAFGETLDVTVPTGNFGNIFAAYLAKAMGLPLGRLVCASNQNNILTDFLKTGVYDRNRPFYTTMSPSMDILISSNLERLLYTRLGADATVRYMRSLADTGKYALTKEEHERLLSDFAGAYTDEEETAAAIRRTYEKYGYLLDTHTAVAMSSAERYMEAAPGKTKMLVVSTASAYKFPHSVLSALSDDVPEDEYEAAKALSALTGVAIPAPIRGVMEKPVRFSDVIAPDEMTAYTLKKAKN